MMFGSQTHESYAAATEETLSKIQGLGNASPSHLRPLFHYLGKHLCDVELTATGAWGKCTLPGRQSRRQFRVLTGMDLREFIQSCRLKVARKLLTQSDLPVHRIARCLGFANLPSFSRTFSRASGQSPISLRKAAAADSGQPPAKMAASPNLLCKALNHVLEPKAATALRDCLITIYPTVGEDIDKPALGQIACGCEPVRIERIKAEAIWRAIAQQPLETQQATLLRVRFTTPALFEMLCEKSREVGRAGRAEGIPMAQLALFSLRSLDPSILSADTRQGLEARAWAWLGNAYCLAQDFVAAEGARAMARRLAPSAGSQTLAHARCSSWTGSFIGASGD